MPLALKPQPTSRPTVQRKPEDRESTDTGAQSTQPDADVDELTPKVRLGAHRQPKSSTSGTVLSTRSLPTGPVDLEDNVRAKPDLDELARRILPLVRRMLIVERDRYSRH
jgi:hypothetical protein